MAEQESASRKKSTSKTSSPTKKDPKVTMKSSSSALAAAASSQPADEKPKQEQLLQEEKKSPVSTPSGSSEPKPPADEPEAEGASGWGGWFQSQLKSATEKSSETMSTMYNYMKQDLAEFTETVKEAASEIKENLKLEDTAKIVVSSVGAKANVVLEQMSTIFGIGPDDDDEELIFSSRSRVRSKIFTMSYDDSLFLEDPKDLEDYENWMARFDLEDEDSDMKVADLLEHNQHLQDSYTRLVPTKVSHLVFWHRFYYLVHLMVEAENDKQLKLSQPVSSSSSSAPNTSDIEIIDSQQDNLIGDAGMVEISEEDQKRLLAEYEEEMKKNDEDSGRNSRRSSGPLSSSSSSSFVVVE